MRATTIKRWAIFIAGLSLLGGTGFFTQRFQISRLAKTVVEQADSALKEGDITKAANLYSQHTIVFPDDVEVRIKYADALLKGPPAPAIQAMAGQIYSQILTRNPGRADVRRKQMALKVDMGRFCDTGAEADLKILLNMDENKNDGNLLFLMGRCCEDGQNDMDAVMWYGKAIEHNAPQRIEAYQRLATLLHGQLNRQKEADRVIEEMVQFAPKNHRVYLERGRYRRQFGLVGSEADFEKALELDKSSFEVYLELAKTAEIESGYDKAMHILKVGLEKAPNAVEIYEALTNLELRNGHIDLAVANIEQGLKSPVNKANLHWILANVLAMRGDTGKLLLQIDELKKIGYPDALIKMLEAHFYVNNSQFSKARQILVPLDSTAKLAPEFKARISDLLAQCYSQLGEPGMQQDAYFRALRSNPHDVTAKLGLVTHMVNQGEIEGAINEYRSLVKRAPNVRLPMAQLLITYNHQRPASQRDWNEAKSLIEAAEKSSPESAELAIVKADLYVAQDQFLMAQDELVRAKSRLPKNVIIWTAQVALLGMQKRFDEAQNLLDQAKTLLGDRVELRLAWAKLLAVKGGPEVLKDLRELGQGVDSFFKEDRRKLLNGLAIELQRLQDLPGAIHMCSRLAEYESNDIQLRLTLLDLAFQTENSNEIERNIKQIRAIEGNSGQMGRYCQVRYLIWQAQRTATKDAHESLRLRTEARTLLQELASRRPDWSVIPLALAQIEQQDVRQTQDRLTEPEILAREESIIHFYRRAIELGEHSSAIVRETVKLLFKNKRGSEAIELLNHIPVESQLAGDLERQASQFAVESQDFERAKQIARKMVAANPGDLQDRIWLVRILLSSSRQDEAEIEILRAVDLAKSDPDRWIALVQFMVLTKQGKKAEEAIKKAEATLPSLRAPLALAQCCEMMGKVYGYGDEAAAKVWYYRAAEWYEKAKTIQPDDFSVVRRLTEFYLRTKQTSAAEAQLNAILKQKSRSQSAETVAWTRRTLALTLASSIDARKRIRALSILKSDSQRTKDTQGANISEDAEALRVLARVLEAQKTAEQRKQAIEILESLISNAIANADDRFLLARLHEINGDWIQARAAYRDLNLRTKNARDLDTLNHRPQYLSQFVSGLLRNHKTSDHQELAEAQDLVDELKRLQPYQLNTLVLQVEVNLACNQFDKALELIQTSAKRSDLTPPSIKTLAELAEKLSRPDVAGQLYHRYSTLANTQDGKVVLAMFLGRHGDLTGALNVLETLWADPRNVELAAAASISLIVSNPTADQAHIKRVTERLEQAIKQKADSAVLQVGLGNCRERQARYDEAKLLYENVVKQGSVGAVESLNGKNLVAASYNNLAWILALKDDQGKDALADVDNAIKLAGPVPDYLDTRGVIYLKLMQTQDAIKDLETAVKADPSPARLFHLCQAYLQAKNREKAKQCWKDAKDKNLEVGAGVGGLHPLEKPAYQKVLSELGSP